MSILLFHNGLAAASLLVLIAGVMLLRVAALVAADVMDPPPLLPYSGRHHEDTVEMHLVPPGWKPPIGARRISALLGDTQRIDPSRLEVSE